MRPSSAGRGIPTRARRAVPVRVLDHAAEHGLLDVRAGLQARPGIHCTSRFSYAAPSRGSRSPDLAGARVARPPVSRSSRPAAMVGIELFYFRASWSSSGAFAPAAEPDKARCSLTFAVLLAGASRRARARGPGFRGRSPGCDRAPGCSPPISPPLLYLRATPIRVFPPVKAELATKVGIEHVFEQYGVTKRERQIVEKICLGKTTSRSPTSCSSAYRP